MKVNNKLLERQLRRLAPKEIPQEWKELIETIDNTYDQFDAEQVMIERTSKKVVNHFNELTQKLKRLNASLDGFNYHVSHDLKTSFMNTMGLSKMLEKYVKVNDTEKINEICIKLNNNATNSINTINEFLNISRLDHEMQQDELTWCNLQGIIASTVYKLEGIEDENVTIDLNGFTEIEFNEVALRSVFHNLITNGIKYKKPNEVPAIKITTEIINQKPVITYTDKGIGIDTQLEKENLFKPFTRLANSKGIEGSGVGLFLIKKIIETSRGSIQLSGEVNKGITVKLTFTENEIR